MPELTPGEIILIAVDKGFISQSQGQTLTEELDLFPGLNPASIMVRRQMISPDQLQKLQVEVARVISLGPVVDDDLDVPASSPARAPLNVPPPVAAKSSEGVRPAGSNFPGFGFGNVNSTAPPASTSAAPSTHQALRLSPTAASSPALARPAAPAVVQVSPVHQTQSSQAPRSLHDYLREARERGCSDLHLVSGRRPFGRLEGKIVFWDAPELTPEQAEALVFSVMDEAQKARAMADSQIDYAFEVPGVGRHRSSIYRQRVGWDGAYRIIADKVPTLQQLAFPPVFQRLTDFHQGLILVTGPTGSGKTTTVAAMLEHINQTRDDHIITVEDPIEYVITPARCQVTQRQVGTHTHSFANALRGALRQDPDVIMVGEMRDLETTSIAISASETGHLVFGTLHTSSTLRTVARVLEMYPSNQRAQIALMVAESTRGIISQQLVPRLDGNARVCAMEILLFTTGVAQIVKEGKTHQLVSHMQSGKRLGMISMDDSLTELYQKKIISGIEAYNRAENKPAFESFRQQV